MLVDHERDLRLALLKGVQQVIQGHGLWDKERRTDQLSQVPVCLRLQEMLEQVLEVEDAHGVVESYFIRRQPCYGSYAPPG
jgi:hypothetical protein